MESCWEFTNALQKEFQANHNFLSKEIDKSLAQNGAKIMKI